MASKFKQVLDKVQEQLRALDFEGAELDDDTKIKQYRLVDLQYADAAAQIAICPIGSMQINVDRNETVNGADDIDLHVAVIIVANDRKYEGNDSDFNKYLEWGEQALGLCLDEERCWGVANIIKRLTPNTFDTVAPRALREFDRYVTGFAVGFRWRRATS